MYKPETFEDEIEKLITELSEREWQSDLMIARYTLMDLASFPDLIVRYLQLIPEENRQAVLNGLNGGQMADIFKVEFGDQARRQRQKRIGHIFVAIGTFFLLASSIATVGQFLVIVGPLLMIICGYMIAI